MEEEKGQLLKSIGFPIPVLRCIDKYASIKGFSRSGLVVMALREYIKNHNLENVTEIKV